MSSPPARRVEIVAALSLATDMAIGQPMEFALRSCALSVWLGEAAGMSPAELREIYYQALLRYIGCNADTYALSALFGDELQFRREIALTDLGQAREVVGVLFRALRRASAGEPMPAAALSIARGLIIGRSTTIPILSGHCEVAERLATRLGFDGPVVRNLGQLYERWDGKGLPNGLMAEAISPAVRLVTLAQDVILLDAAHGTEATRALIERRRGKAYEPRMVDAFLAKGAPLLRQVREIAAWDQVLALEPTPHMLLDEAGIDEACLAIADFVDIRAPYTAGHSRTVAVLAEAAARRCGLPESDAIRARRAGLLHDLGELAIPMATWIKSGPLTDRERDEIRLHPHHTERILARSACLAPLGAIAGQHHECLNGSGYHRGLRSNAIAPLARILAVAEAYQTHIEERPHRPALTSDAAATDISRRVRTGEFDSEAAAAVLAAAGHRVASAQRQLAADLTRREIDVLRLISGGRSTKEVARDLGISPKTADNHIQSIYAKIGVTTRAGAVLFAIERGLANAP